MYVYQVFIVRTGFVVGVDKDFLDVGLGLPESTPKYHLHPDGR